MSPAPRPLPIASLKVLASVALERAAEDLFQCGGWTLLEAELQLVRLRVGERHRDELASGGVVR